MKKIHFRFTMVILAVLRAFMSIIAMRRTFAYMFALFMLTACAAGTRLSVVTGSVKENPAQYAGREVPYPYMADPAAPDIPPEHMARLQQLAGKYQIVKTLKDKADNVTDLEIRILHGKVLFTLNRAPAMGRELWPIAMETARCRTPKYKYPHAYSIECINTEHNDPAGYDTYKVILLPIQPSGTVEVWQSPPLLFGKVKKVPVPAEDATLQFQFFAHPDFESGLIHLLVKKVAD